MKVNTNKTMIAVIMVGGFMLPLSLQSTTVCNKSGHTLEISGYSFEESHLAGIKNNYCYSVNAGTIVWQSSSRGTSYKRIIPRDNYQALVIYRKGLSMLVEDEHNVAIYEEWTSKGVKQHDEASFKKMLKKLYPFEKVAKLLEHNPHEIKWQR